MKTILLADDEENLRTLVRTTLDDPQRRILEVTDGVAALEVSRREQPDLIILDWMMPGMSGIEVARALRLNPDTAHIPIIMLTAKGQESDRELGFAVGVYAYLVKPFSPIELLEQVEQVTRASDVDLPDATAEVQRELDTSQSQLALYARDLRRIASAERRRARELAQANERLQMLDRLKMDFLVFISHELRTPLQHMAVVKLLDPHGDPGELAQMCEMLRNGYERLESFVSKGLQYFQWLATRRVDVAESADLAEALSAVVAGMPALVAPGVDFRLSTPGAPCLVRGERKYLEEVVRVLLDNAIKFSRHEKTIRADLRTTGDQVTLTIADRGQGFSPELAHELFRPFTISDVLHHSQGTGLSLALASAIVQAYGGGIRAESRGLGTGATFEVYFPALRTGH